MRKLRVSDTIINMKISDHFLGYPKQTILVVTNNELAKLYRGFEREVTELEVIEAMLEKPAERAAGTANAAPPDVDELKRRNRFELYARLSERLQDLLRGEAEEIVMCAPEAYKNEIVEAMHTDVQKAIVELVPKNLASLPLDQVIRILQESKPKE